MNVIGLSAMLILVAAPLTGWPKVVRLPAVIVPSLVLALLVARPWRWPNMALRAADWQPAARSLMIVALIIGASLFWYVLSRFRAGEINAVDFTVYFDRPCFQTVQGRPLFVEISDTPGYSNRSELADHAYWAMLPICSVYALTPSPLWLHALSALAIAAGAFHVLRILQFMGTGGVLACATAAVFVLNDNTARTLNYGFHPEVLYAWFVPWMIHAGLKGRRNSFLFAALATILVKEDSVLPVLAATLALGIERWSHLSRSDRWTFLVFPNVAAIANLAVFFGWIVPMLTGRSVPTYAHFWGNYGDTPVLAALAMLSQPGRVLTGVMASGIVKVLMPHLFLPAAGWRWTLGLIPIIALYGASANHQVQAFGIYYAIVLVPFLVIGASLGALAIARRFTREEGRAQLVATAAILAGALLVGGGRGSYSIRPWKTETSSVKDALKRLPAEPIVLIQSGLFPHAGYSPQAVLLTPETLQDPENAGAAVLIAPRVGAYPYKRADFQALADLTPLAEMPEGIMALRVADVEARLHPEDPIDQRDPEELDELGQIALLT